jgi:hypothetical protein
VSLGINDQGNLGGGPLTGTRTVNVVVMSDAYLFADGFE